MQTPHFLAAKAKFDQLLEGELEICSLDAIDLFQLHGFDARTPIEETLGVLDDLVHCGKIRYVGCSNFSVVAHPECTYAVRLLADEVCSTEKMVSHCRSSPAKAFIIVTESGMLHRLKRELPDKEFIPELPILRMLELK